MVERVDYIVQIAASLVGTVISSMGFYKKRKLPYFLLTGFYATLGLGNLYLLLHIVLTGKLPFFYTAELAWTAGYVFLLALMLTVPSENERKYFSLPALIMPAVCMALMVYFIVSCGDPLGNITMCVPTAALSYCSLRGLLYGRKNPGHNADIRYFHVVILAFVILEYSLWFWSVPWVSDTLTNPYFWCDFMISAVILFLYPAVNKAVKT